MQDSHERCRREKEPLKRGKRRTRLRGVAHPAEADAVAEEDGQRNKASEPEDHGDGFGSQDSVLVRGIREAGRCDDEVGEGEEGPNGGKDEEVYFRGGEVVPMA